MTEAPHISRRKSRQYLQNDFQLIKDKYVANACLFEEMNFEDEEDQGWAKLARSFLLRHKICPDTGRVILVNPKIE